MMRLRKKKREKRERRREQLKELLLILLKIPQLKTMNNLLMEKDNLQKEIMKVVSLILKPKHFIVNMLSIDVKVIEVIEII